MIEAKTITHVVEHQSMVATNCPCNCPGKDEKLAGEFLQMSEAMYSMEIQ